MAEGEVRRRLATIVAADVAGYSRLMEAVARFDETYSNDYPGGALAATLSQIQDAHAHADGVGESGEFTLARRRAAARLERARATDKQPASD